MSINHRYDMKNPIVRLYTEADAKLPGSEFTVIHLAGSRNNQEWLERSHDYIQYLFPTDISSEFERTAPLLTKDVAVFLSKSYEFRTLFPRVVAMMMHFYGMDLWPGDYSIITIPNQYEGRREYINASTHDHRRISRMLRCVSMIPGFEKLHESVLRAFVSRLDSGEFYPRLDERGRNERRQYWQSKWPFPIWCGEFITPLLCKSLDVYISTRDSGVAPSGGELDSLARAGLPESFVKYAITLKLSTPVPQGSGSSPARSQPIRAASLSQQTATGHLSTRDPGGPTVPEDVPSPGRRQHSPKPKSSLTPEGRRDVIELSSDSSQASQEEEDTQLKEKLLQDIEILRSDTEWFRTHIMWIYGMLLNQNSILGKDGLAYMADPDSFRKFQSSEEVDSVLRRNVHLRTRLLLVPVNLSDNHWVLLVISTKSAIVYDPLGDRDSIRVELARQVQRFALATISCDPKEVPKFTLGIRRQSDGHSCGPLCLAAANGLMNAGHFCSNEFLLMSEPERRPKFSEMMSNPMFKIKFDEGKVDAKWIRKVITKQLLSSHVYSNLIRKEGSGRSHIDEDE